MVLHGPRATIEAINNLNALELKSGAAYEASWHYQFRHSCYVFCGGLGQDFSEGDVVIVFSQFGEVIDVHLARDKESGKPKGYAFVGYEDARSAVLAVDNLNGARIAGRLLRVDHVKDYKRQVGSQLEPSGAEGKGLGVYNVTRHQSGISLAQRERRKQMKQKREVDMF